MEYFWEYIFGSFLRTMDGGSPAEKDFHSKGQSPRLLLLRLHRFFRLGLGLMTPVRNYPKPAHSLDISADVSVKLHHRQQC